MRDILRERHFSVDDFNQPKKSEGKDAIGVLIIRLILMEPGTDQTRPEMGLGLVSKFRYMQPSEMQRLSSDLKNQLSSYLTPYSNVKVTITMDKEKQLTFDIKIDDNVYKYVTSEQESNKIMLSELLQ